MQKIIGVAGGIKAYHENPDCLVNEDTLKCPFCPDQHRLRRHGWYLRFAFLLLLPVQRIAIRRLLCTETGKTLSLLPDFCLPRRQHGPALLGVFLHHFINGKSLVEAFQKARPEASGHSRAQSLKEGFVKRAHNIRTYLASLFHRVVKLPEEIPKERRSLAELVLGLTEGFTDPAAAFTHHGYHFHKKLRTGLA